MITMATIDLCALLVGAFYWGWFIRSLVTYADTDYAEDYNNVNLIDRPTYVAPAPHLRRVTA